MQEEARGAIPPRFTEREWMIIRLARNGIAAPAIAVVCSETVAYVLRTTAAARLAGVPMLRLLSTSSPPSREQLALARLFLTQEGQSAPLVVPPEERLSIHDAAAQYFVSAQLIRDAFAASELPAIQIVPEGFWSRDVEEYLARTRQKFVGGQRPIMGKTGLVLALAREGFAPKTIGEALEWEDGSARVSSMLFTIRSTGIETPLFSSEYTASDNTPERVREARQRAQSIMAQLPLEYYPPVEEKTMEGKVPDDLVIRVYDEMVGGRTWSDAQEIFKEHGYRFSRQAFYLRYSDLGLKPPAHVRSERRAGGRRTRAAVG